MSLIYCPFSKNCATCAVDNIFTLKDGDGRKFKVRRYKLTSCRFEVYNQSAIRAKSDFNKQIFDFTTLTKRQADEIIDLYYNKTANANYAFTSGNLLKGVE